MRTMQRSFALLALAAAFLLSLPARALSYDVCVKYGIDFGDAGSGVGDDHFTTNDDKVARGAHIRVWLNSTGASVADAYADAGGATPGCLTGVVATAGASYTVWVETLAEIGNNVVEVFVDDSEASRYAQSWTWVPSHTLPTVTFPTVPADHWNIAAAAGRAAWAHDGGQSGERYRWYTQNCPGDANSCVRQRGGFPAWAAYLCPSTDCTETLPTKSKYLIGHQMGHLVSIFANGDARAALDTTAEPDNCDGVGGGTGHHLHSKEYQGSAAYEGIAHAWAALAFNNSGPGADCGFQHYIDLDWNNDGAENTTSIFNCDGNLPDGFDGGDYLGDACTGTLNGRATEVDWLRFWWDLQTDEGLSDDALFSTWAGASLHTWDPNGTLGPAHPPNRLSAARPAWMSSTTWGTHATANGVQR
jgi:hypothetical protein